VSLLTDAIKKKFSNWSVFAWTQHDLAASKLRVGLLVNFGGDSLEWKRIVL